MSTFICKTKTLYILKNEKNCKIIISVSNDNIIFKRIGIEIGKSCPDFSLNCANLCTKIRFFIMEIEIEVFFGYFVTEGRYGPFNY